MCPDERREGAGASAHPHVRLLDGFEVTYRGARVELSTAPARTVACLALRTEARTRSTVAGLLWPDMPEQRARANLRSALWRIGRCCPSLIEHTTSTLRMGRQVRVDLRDLDAWCRRVLDGTDTTCALPGYLTGLELLPSWDEEWLDRERLWITSLYVHALERLVQLLVGRHRLAEALLAAQAAIDTDPWRESAWHAAISVQIAQGNAAAAVRMYSDYCARLRELQVLPGEDLHQVVRRVGAEALGDRPVTVP